MADRANIAETRAATDKITALGILNGRMAHLATVVGNMMYMVGGYCSNNDSSGRGKDKDVAVAMKDVYLYSLREGKWRKAEATGDIPASGSGMCMAASGQYLYVFGGLVINVERMREFSNKVYRLDTQTLIWKCLSPEYNVGNMSTIPSVRDKAAMIYYDNALWMFAGWGVRIYNLRQNAQFIPDPTHESVGWNNELWKFDLITNTWSTPTIVGSVPAPRAAHTLTMYSDHEAVLFGGRTRQGRVSELYFLDLKQGVWSGPVDAGPGPQPRSLHTTTKLHDGKVLLLGGMNHLGDSVKAQWLLHTNASAKWERVTLQEEKSCGRTWHTTCANNATPCCTELLVFGGSPDNIWHPEHQHWARMTRFYYGVRPLYDLCVEHMADKDPGPSIPHDISDDIESRRVVINSLKKPSVTYSYETVIEQMTPTAGAS